MNEQKSPSTKRTSKRLASSEALRRVMTAHYQDLFDAAAHPKRKVAWCSSMGPVELLRALGFAVFFPENHAAMLGASRTANQAISRAAADGFSSDICSYLTSDIGAFLEGRSALETSYPFAAGLPTPDVLVYGTNQCRDIGDWFSWYGRKLGVPCYAVEGFVGLDRINSYHVEAIAARLVELASTLEVIAGKKLDPDELRDFTRRSKRCSNGWKAALETNRRTPAPWTFFDQVLHMAPAVVGRGTDEAADYYELLVAELDERASRGVAAVRDEALRLYWEGMPIWGRIRDLERLFSQHRSAVVGSTYCSSWVFDALDAQDPFEGIARASVELFICRSERAKEQILAHELERFSAAAIIFHDARTCASNTNCRYGLPRRLSASTSAPHIIVYADHNDLRVASDERIATQIEALLEQLGGS